MAGSSRRAFLSLSEEIKRAVRWNGRCEQYEVWLVKLLFVESYKTGRRSAGSRDSHGLSSHASQDFDVGSFKFISALTELPSPQRPVCLDSRNHGDSNDN